MPSPNTIQFSFTTPSKSHLKFKNFKLGVMDQDYGPTSTTGFWSGVNPQSGGYIVYINKDSNGPSIVLVENESSLRNLLLQLNPGYIPFNPTLPDLLNSLYGSSGNITGSTIQNISYENVITDNLVLNYDIGFLHSLISSASTTIYNISPVTLSQDYVSRTNTSYSTSNGGYLYFDGTDDKMGPIIIFTPNIDPQLVLTGNCTIEFFVRIKEVNVTQPLFSADALRIGDLTINSSNRISYSYGNGTNSQTFTSLSSVSDETWYQVCVVRDLTGKNSNGSPKLYLYLNGSLDNEATATYTNVPFNNPTIVNLFWNNGAIYTEIDFSIVRIYTQALSSTEVLQNFNAQKSRFGL